MRTSAVALVCLAYVCGARRVQTKERVRGLHKHNGSEKIADTAARVRSSAEMIQSKSSSGVNPLKFLAVLLATSPVALAQMQSAQGLEDGAVNHTLGKRAGPRSALLHRRNPGYENVLDSLVHGGSDYEVPQWQISQLDTWPPPKNHSDMEMHPDTSLDGSFASEHEDDLYDEELYDVDSPYDGVEEALDLEHVMDVLEVDIPRLLHKDPHWDIFTEDFAVYDQNGDSVQGLESNKDLLKLLRKVRKKFKVNDDIEILGVESDGRGPHLLTRWKVQMNQVNSTFLPMWANTIFHQVGRTLFSTESPIEIEVETMFHFNEYNMIDYMQIDKWLVNGQPWSSFLWPDVTLADNGKTNLKKIKDWAQIMRNISDDPAYRMDADDIELYEQD